MITTPHRGHSNIDIHFSLSPGKNMTSAWPLHVVVSSSSSHLPRFYTSTFLYSHILTACALVSVHSLLHSSGVKIKHCVLCITRQPDHNKIHFPPPGPRTPTSRNTIFAVYASFLVLELLELCTRAEIAPRAHCSVEKKHQIEAASWRLAVSHVARSGPETKRKAQPSSSRMPPIARIGANIMKQCNPRPGTKYVGCASGSDQARCSEPRYEHSLRPSSQSRERSYHGVRSAGTPSTPIPGLKTSLQSPNAHCARHSRPTTRHVVSSPGSALPVAGRNDWKYRFVKYGWN
mmetsp:Transcript_941/g.3732  ORF Transcript_941/g.3732 Transcript_941/m.3732 type:complete len:290 (-) Transcript_941:259-1128(-)